MARVTLNIPPGVVEDDTDFTIGQGAWIEADKVRFWRGRPQLWGGWELATAESLTGACRGLFSWRDNSDVLNIGLGTNSNLYAYVGGDLFTITPTSGFVAGNVDGTGGQGYGTGAFSTGLYSQPSTSDFFPLTWAMASFGENLIASPRGQTIFQWTNDGSAAAVSLGRSAQLTDDLTYADQTAADAVWTRGGGWTFDAANDQFDASTASADVTRSVTGLTVGKYYRVQISVSNVSAGTIAALEGSTPGETLSADGDAYVTFKASATSATVGAQGVGFTGSLDADFVVYELNAPDECTYMTVTPQRQIMAYGVREEISDRFNPRAVRFCDIEDVNDWVTEPSNNAGEIVLDGSGALVAARETAYGAFVWTTNELYFREFIGNKAQTYRFTPIGNNCGLIGPNACAVLGQTAYWMSADGQFWRCAVGGGPERLPSPVQDEIAGNIQAAQATKIYAASIAEFNEIIWFYPDARDGDENSRAYAFQISERAWSGPHRLARTAIVDAGPGPSPLAVSPDGEVFFHERGLAANGRAISGVLATGDIYVANAGQSVMIRSLSPDIDGQQGQIALRVETKDYPRSDPAVDRELTIAPGTTRLHWRTSGRIIRMRFSWEAGPVSGRFGPLNLDIIPRGRGAGSASRSAIPEVAGEDLGLFSESINDAEYLGLFSEAELEAEDLGAF